MLALLPEDKPVLLVANKLDAGQAPRRRAALAGVDARAARLRRVRADVGHARGRRRSACSASSRRYLPQQPWFYDEDTLTDRSERFLASELIREKLFRLTGDELPYSSTVVIDKFEEDGNLRRIAATIVVEREAHKGMVIGDGGERLKRIGSEARQELERLLDAKVFLELWVKVRSGWAERRGAPAQLRLRMRHAVRSTPSRPTPGPTTPSSAEAVARAPALCARRRPADAGAAGGAGRAWWCTCSASTSAASTTRAGAWTRWRSHPLADAARAVGAARGRARA